MLIDWIKIKLSDLKWWWMELQADRDIAAGRYKGFDSIKELIEDLHRD